MDSKHFMHSFVMVNIVNKCFAFCFSRLVIENLQVTRFVAKIGMTNEPSVKLFTNKLHFQIVIISISLFNQH